MAVFLIRVSLMLQMLSLPLLTPQVIGEQRMDAIRQRLNAAVRPTAKVAGIVFAVCFVVAVGLLVAPALYASANHTTVTAESFDSYPGWAQEIGRS